MKAAPLTDNHRDTSKVELMSHGGIEIVQIIVSRMRVWTTSLLHIYIYIYIYICMVYYAALSREGEFRLGNDC